MSDSNTVIDADVVLVGAGIMSTTLAVFLKELQPHLKLEIIERLGSEAQESPAPGTMPAPVTPPIAS